MNEATGWSHLKKTLRSGVFVAVLAILSVIMFHVYSVYSRMTFYNDLKGFHYIVIFKYATLERGFPDAQNENGNWRDAIQPFATKYGASRFDRAWANRHGILFMGVTGPLSPWGYTRGEWGTSIKGRDFCTYPLILAIRGDGVINLQAVCDIYTDDPCNIVREQPGPGLIPCYSLNTDGTITTAFFDASLAQEISRNGLKTNIW